MHITILVVHLPVLVCTAILFRTPSNHHSTDDVRVRNIDFVNNNPASFKDAYFDFASILQQRRGRSLDKSLLRRSTTTKEYTQSKLCTALCNLIFITS